MNSLFEITDTCLPPIKIIQRRPIADSRGFLERLFCSQDFQSVLRDKTILQINHTLTLLRGTIRGLHFQRAPHSETKVVSCIRGEVFDVAVDIRKGSPTFLHWHGEILSASNHKALLVPEGFAHGFQTLMEDCELLYFHTAAYNLTAEGALNARDPGLKISWPLPVSDMSSRDVAHPFVGRDFTGIHI